MMRRKQRSEKQVVMLFSAPLCYADANHVRPLPQPAFDAEWRVMMEAHAEAQRTAQPRNGKSKKLKAIASLTARPLTAANLQRIVAPSAAGVATTILHLSAHGTGDSLIL